MKKLPIILLALVASYATAEAASVAPGPMLFAQPSGASQAPSDINALGPGGTGNITVVSTVNWPVQGIFIAGTEWLRYSIIDSTHFKVNQRGVCGTTGASHSNGISILYLQGIAACPASGASDFYIGGTGAVAFGIAPTFADQPGTRAATGIHDVHASDYSVPSCPTFTSCADASTALNTAISTTAAAGQTLIIDLPYYCGARCSLVSNAKIDFEGTGVLIQGFTPASSSGVLSQTDVTTPITNVWVRNLQMLGDSTHTLGGNMVYINCTGCDFNSSHIHYFAAPTTGGRAWLVAAKNSVFSDVNFDGPADNSGAGGFRFLSCDTSQVLGGYGVSGDDVWQFVPSVSGNNSNQDINNCSFSNVGGASSTGRLFIAALIDTTAGYSLDTGTPLAGGSGYSNGTITLTGGTCTTAPTLLVTQTNSGAITQARVTNGGKCSVKPDGTTSTTTDGGSGGTFTLRWNNYASMSDSIKGSSFTGIKGSSTSNRGFVVQNSNSSGTIDGLLIDGISVDASTDYNLPQAGFIFSPGRNTRIGTVTLNDVTIRNPFGMCLYASGYYGSIFNLRLNNLDCGRPHRALMGAITVAAAAGDTSVSLAAKICSQIKNGDSIAVALDDNMAVNGGYSSRLQPFTLGGDCSGTTLTLPSALLGASSGNVYDYTVLPIPTVATVSSGHDIQVQSDTPLTVGDSVRLSYDDGTTLSSTISTLTNGSPNGTPDTVTIAATITKTATAGNLLVDTSVGSTTQSILVRGVRAGNMDNAIAHGGGLNPIVIGNTAGPQYLTSDFDIKNPQIYDVQVNGSAIQQLTSDHDPVRGGYGIPMAGATGGKGTAFTSTAPSYSTTLAVAIDSSQTSLIAADVAAFPYRHNFYIIIGSEVLLVTGGYQTGTLTVVRAQLGTSAATHAVGAAIAVAQASAVESPITDFDVGAMGNTTCAAAVATYPVGQGDDVSLKGCDAGSSPLASASAVTYSDFAQTYRVTGSTNINSLTVSATTPPFKAKTFNLYNSTGSSLTIANGAGFTNAGAGTLTLTAKGVAQYYFDPATQIAREMVP